VTEAEAVAAICLVYWIMAGLWIFFVKDTE
jgi:hypothetical protein